jgi:hypothetical protein
MWQCCQVNVHLFHPSGKSPKMGIEMNSAQLEQKPCIPKAIH